MAFSDGGSPGRTHPDKQHQWVIWQPDPNRIIARKKLFALLATHAEQPRTKKGQGARTRSDLEGTAAPAREFRLHRATGSQGWRGQQMTDGLDDLDLGDLLDDIIAKGPLVKVPKKRPGARWGCSP